MENNREDSFGYIPEPELIGTVWKHYTNGYLYVVTGFSWFGDADQWLIQLVREDSQIVFTRSVSSFKSCFKNDTRRFTEVVPEGGKK